MQNMYTNEYQAVENLDVESRATFITRTYTHLLGAILAFTGLEVALFTSGIADSIAPLIAQNWLIVMGGFLLVGWLGSRAAVSATSMATQYLALAGYVVMEAVIFVPILWIANSYYPGVISSAAAITLTGFGLLTFIAFWTRKDFSFMGGMLRWIGVGALIAIVASLLFSFTLGVWFSVAMILFAGAAVLYDTSNVLHHYPEDRYVAASLSLFASIAMLFFYVLRILMSLRDSREAHAGVRARGPGGPSKRWLGALTSSSAGRPGATKKERRPGRAALFFCAGHRSRVPARGTRAQWLSVM